MVFPCCKDTDYFTISNFFLINLRFPHPLLFSCLPMGGVRSLHSYAVVGALTVIEMNEAFYLLQGILIRRKATCLPVNALSFDDSVHALGNAVVCGLVILSHRYQYAVFLQLFHVKVAAVLHTSVGVMDKSCEVASASLFDGHTECPEREDCRQRFRQAPADNLFRICIGDEVQVAASTGEFDVGDVTHP